jgi:type VI protein secretion system component Hcp
MAYETKLIIPGLLGNGNALRQHLLWFSLGSVGQKSQSKDLNIGLDLDDNTHKFYELALSGQELPLMKIEITDVTKTTIKTVLEYEFTGSMLTSYQISGAHSGESKPSIMITFNYREVKSNVFK